MIGKTSMLFVVTFVISLAVFTASDAHAFEPTNEEERVMMKYIIITLEIEEVCSGDDDRHEGCVFLKTRQGQVLSQINHMGIYIDGQEPRLDHLTEEYTSTRQTAQAGIYPERIDSGNAIEAYRNCDSCDKKSEKTMYVKAGYKDPWFLWGFSLWDYYAGKDSADISSGATSAGFEPQWPRGLNQGIIPYCHTSSVSLPANAEYGISMLMLDYREAVLVPSGITYHESEFLWYDTNDKIEYPEQNNVVSGPDIVCTISDVSVN